MSAQQLRLPLFKTVKVRNKSSARYVYQGKRKRYTFDPQQVLEVDDVDAQELLAKERRGGGCCGSQGSGGYKLFEIVED